LVFIILVTPAAGCADKKHTLRVTATAYNSVQGQTQGDPNLTAWGEKLLPGMKAIEKSPDTTRAG
jgi:hypothetical protein